MRMVRYESALISARCDEFVKSSGEEGDGRVKISHVFSFASA